MPSHFPELTSTVLTLILAAEASHSVPLVTVAPQSRIRHAILSSVAKRGKLDFYTTNFMTIDIVLAMIKVSIGRA